MIYPIIVHTKKIWFLILCGQLVMTDTFGTAIKQYYTRLKMGAELLYNNSHQGALMIIINLSQFSNEIRIHV